MSEQPFHQFHSPGGGRRVQGRPTIFSLRIDLGPVGVEQDGHFFRGREGERDHLRALRQQPFSDSHVAIHDRHFQRLAAILVATQQNRIRENKFFDARQIALLRRVVNGRER